jgi:hypothetical protein
MKKLISIALILLLTVALYNCQEEETVPGDQPRDYTKISNLLVNNNPAELSSRITYKDRLIPVRDVEQQDMLKSDEEEGYPEVDITKNYAFKLKAEVAPPEHEGSKLQATHVTIKDDYAFVTYNTKGSEWLGGIEIFDVSDRKNPSIVSSAVMPNADVNAVDYANGKLYVVGATGDYQEMGFGSPAFMEAISLNEDMGIADVDTILDLSSYAGTDVRVAGEKIYATSGSEGGLSVFNTGYTQTGTKELDHARAVDTNSDKLYVLQGQEGRINTFSLQDATHDATYNVGGANTPESKSEIAVSDEYIFAALNEGGMVMLNPDGTVKQTIPKPETPDDGIDKNHVTNSVSLNNDLVLIGNGASGVHVGGIVEEKSDSLWMMGSMQFDGPESTNFVESKDSVIFVATGKGGLKIIDISIDDGVPGGIDPTEPCETLMGQISEMFPEQEDVRGMHDKLFSDTAHLNIKVTEETPVYVTFIDEGAAWKNTFGYYTYPADDPPESVEDLDKHIVFPNVSKVGEGGGLEFGDRVQLGDESFESGTVIGFYVVAQGWKNGMTVDGLYTQYTNREFNAEGAQQSTLFLSSNCDDIVLTFEDIRVNSSRCDHDFNDIIVTVKDTKDMTVPNTKLKLSGLPRK